jgi:hypothetical protein
MNSTPVTSVVYLNNKVVEIDQELANIEASVGLDIAGQYIPDASGIYIQTATSVQDSLVKVDEQLYSTASTYAPLTYVDEAISNVIANAPSNLDVLKEVSDALNNDPYLFSTLNRQISLEELAARGAEATLTTNVSTEINRATGAESTLTSYLNSTISAHVSKEQSLSTLLADEIVRAVGAESTISSFININLINDLSTLSATTTSTVYDDIAVDLSGGLHFAINQEEIRSLAADQFISTALANETVRAIGAESTISSNLTSEQLRAITIENSISTLVGEEKVRAITEENSLASRTSTIELNYIQKDGSVTFTGSIDANNNKFINISTPTLGTSAANKLYVDSKIAALGSVFEYKGNLNPSVTPSLDSLTVETGDYYKVIAAGSVTAGASTLVLSVDDALIKSATGWDYIKNQEMTMSSGSSGSKITVTGSTNAGYTVDIASGYTGQNSITTLGTVATGRWQASIISSVKGGSGFGSYASGDLLVGISSTSTLKKLAVGANGTMLKSVSGKPEWKPADSENIKISSITNFPNMSTTQQAIDYLYTFTEQRKIALAYTGQTADYADALVTNDNLTSGKVNFIKPTQSVEARFESDFITASSHFSTNYAIKALDTLSTSCWQASNIGTNSYNPANGVYQGSTITKTSPSFSWVKQLGSFNTYTNDTVTNKNVGADAAGNIYVTYQTTGNVTGKTRKGISDIVVFKLNSSGVLEWVKQESTFNTTGNNILPKIAVDSTGNCYIAYLANAALPGKTKTAINSANNDLILFALDTTGALLWTKQDNTYNTTNANGQAGIAPYIVLDSSNNIVISYGAIGTVPGNTVATQGWDPVVAKFNPGSGNLIWVKQSPSFATTANDSGMICATDASNNIVIAFMNDSAAIPGGTFSGRTDVIFCKLDSNGNFLWGVQNNTFNTADHDEIWGLTCDSSGNIYSFLGRGAFFITKLNPSGSLVFHKAAYVPSNSFQRGMMTRDSNNNIYHIFNSQRTSGGTTYGLGGWDIAIAKYNTNGDLIWSQDGGAAINTIYDETFPSVTVDNSGNVVAVYQTIGTVAGGSLTGSSDIVVVKYSQGGSMNSANVFTYGEYIQMSSITSSFSLSKYSVRGLSGQETRTSPTSFQILGSSNALIWNTLDTQSNLTFTANELKSFTLSTISAAYPIYRFVATGVGSSAGNGSRSTIQVAELNLFSQVSVAAGTSAESIQTIGVISTLASTTPNSAPNCFDYLSTTSWNSGSDGNTAYSYNSTTGIYAGRSLTYNKPSVVWTRQTSVLNTTGSEVTVTAGGIDYDTAGNSYATYYTDGATSGNIKTGGNDVVVAKLDSTGNVLWNKQANTFNTSTNDMNSVIAVAKSNGNVYIAYNVEAVTTGTTGNTFSGSRDIAVAKFDTSGTLQWVKQQPTFNTTAADYNPAITLDSNENVIVSYVTEGAIPGQTNAGGTRDIVMFKLDSSGTLVWTKQNSSFNSGTSEYFPVRLATDVSDNIILSYSLPGSATGGTNVLNGGSASWDIVIHKFDSTGTKLWTKQDATYLTSGNEGYLLAGDGGHSIACDSNKNIYVAYTTTGTVPGGTFAGGTTDLAVAKLNESGSVLWVKQTNLMNDSQTPTSPSIAVDAQNYVYIAFTNGAYTGQLSAGNKEINIAKFDSSGNFIWVGENTEMNATGNDDLPTIRIDSNYNIYLVQQAGGNISGGTSAGSNDVIVTKLSQGNMSSATLNTTYTGEWIQAKLDKGHAIKYYKIRSFAGVETTRTPASWFLLGSENGNNGWTLLDTQTDVVFTTNQEKRFTLSSISAEYQYYRIVVTKVGNSLGNGSRQYVQIAEITFYKTSAAGGSGSSASGVYDIYLPPTNANLPNGSIMRLVHNGEKTDNNYTVKFKNTTTNTDIGVVEIMAGDSMSFIWNSASSTYLNAVGI